MRVRTQFGQSRMTSSSLKTPELSIVVAAWNDITLLRQCLASMQGQAEIADTEIIVASNFGCERNETIKELFAHVNCICLPESATVPQLRAAGIASAQGEVIALIEDHCTLDEKWCAEVKKAHKSSQSIVGGAVENASRERLLDWAVYFYDYGRFMLPGKAGVVSSLSGMNISYKRFVLESVGENYREGFFEAFINEQLKEQGHSLYLQPSMIVYHQKKYRMGDALIQCYHLARSFAGRRVLNDPRLKRASFIVGSLMLPVLLPARIVLTIAEKRRHLKELFLSLPHLVTLMASWSFGELCGYLLGEGASGGKWR